MLSFYKQSCMENKTNAPYLNVLPFFVRRMRCNLCDLSFQFTLLFWLRLPTFLTAKGFNCCMKIITYFSQSCHFKLFISFTKCNFFFLLSTCSWVNFLYFIPSLLNNSLRDNKSSWFILGFLWEKNA